MSAYPVMYAQHPQENRNRLTVFFRFFMVIPHVLWMMIYGIAFAVAVFCAWFAIVFTGRWPAGLYDFSAGFLRFSSRLTAYMFLVTDEFPPFDGGEHPEYPIRAAVAPPKPEYDRLKAFFRIILAIPIAVVQYIMQLWLMAVAIAVWFVAVFTGRTSAGLIEAMRLPMAYYVRSSAYFYLITEDWPPFDPGPPELPAGPGGGGQPSLQKSPEAV